MARSLPANILPLALTQGDPSGIGPELTLKAWLKTHDKPDAPPFLAVANPDRLAAIARDSVSYTHLTLPTILRV